MTPYYDHGGITIYHGDCREILPELEPVDLVLTSPPYNIGNIHHRGKSRHRPYDDNLDEDAYQAQQVVVLDLLFRKAESVIYNHKNRIKNGWEVSPREWIGRSQWKIRQAIVWINGGPNHDPRRFYPKTERLYWLSKQGAREAENHSLWDVLTDCPDAVPLSSKSHTRTFPLTLAKKTLSVFPWAGTILDPYVGSGTTIRAAKDLGRQAIGIEIEERYCEIAANRLRQEVLF